jgi:3-methyladenine DNA glycosylase AlkD
MLTVADILDKLAKSANSANLPEMARFGMTTGQRLGASVPAMRQIAKEIGRNHAFALSLWETGIADARILASMLADPSQFTRDQAEQWVRAFNSWDVCDQVCMNLFEKTPWAWQKIPEWAVRQEEFVKRAAFALIAGLAWHDKQATDEQFIQLFPLLKSAAIDDRNFVKKAVNWALRNIGKRNYRLNQAGTQLGQELHQFDSSSARWIAADALRELNGDAVQRRLHNPS